MQYLTLALTTLVSMATAEGPMFRFTEYGTNDVTCDPINLLKPSLNVDAGQVGASNQLPDGTSSIYYDLLTGSEGGYKVELFTSNTCLGDAELTFTPEVGERGCKAPTGDGWACLRVTKA